jgi:hypothetical protein
MLHPTVGNVVINPGTGPVADASEGEARRNMRAFVTDMALPGCHFRRRRRGDDGNGRYCFVIRRDGSRPCEIQMPGWPLDRVRWQEGANPWRFPRLDVDGSSWLWGFAVGIAASSLTEQAGSER